MSYRPEYWRPRFAGVDAANPLSRGLLRLYHYGSGSRGADAGNRSGPWSLGSLAERATEAGPGVRINATATATSGEVLGTQLSDGITVLMLASKHAQIVNSDWIFGAHAASVGLYDWGFIESASGGPLSFYCVNSGGTIAATPSSTLWAANAGVQAWVGTWGNGDNNVRQYCNGVQTGSTALTGTLRNSSLPVRTCFWNNGTPDFTLVLAGVWNRCLSPAEVAQLSRAPWSLLRARRRNAFVTVPASGGLTLAVDHGTLTLAGQSIALATSMPVSHGSVSLSGQAITLATSMPVSHGSVSLSGQSIALATTMPVTAGALTLAGQSIALQLGGNISLAVDHGTLALAGQPIGLRTTMPVTAGALTLAGQSITLQAGGSLTLPVDHGSVTLTGQEVGLVLPAAPSRVRFAFARREARAVFARRGAACAFSRRTATAVLG